MNKYLLKNCCYETPKTAFDRFFSDVDQMLVPLRSQNTSTVLACDIHETPTDYLMSFDLPGVPKDNISINVAAGELIITAHRKEEKISHEGTTHRQERMFGEVTRRFSLPKDSDPGHIDASFEDGVLYLSLAKKKTAEPSQVKINPGKGNFHEKLGKAPGV